MVTIVASNECQSVCKVYTFQGGCSGLAVMRGGSCSGGRGFKSPAPFSQSVSKFVVFVWKIPKKTKKSLGIPPYQKKSTASKCFLGLFSRLNAVRNFVVAAGCSYKVNVGRRIDPKTLWTIYLFVWIIESANMDSKKVSCLVSCLG